MGRKQPPNAWRLACRERCPGAILGRQELVITLQEWLKRIPDFELANAQAPRTNGGIVASMPALELRWRA